MWSNGVGLNRETDEEHDGNCVEEGFRMARVKFGRDGEGSRKKLWIWGTVVSIFEMDQNLN